MEKSKHLVLDVGNSRVKYGYFEQDVLLTSGVCSDWTAHQWNVFHQKHPFSRVLVGSVGATVKDTISKLPENCVVHTIDKTIKYPFTSAYDDIQTLGVDRRAALAAVLKTHPETPVLIIDAGSCITYDYINEKAHHEGGAISPGRAMRYYAMHLFTAKLPFLKPSDKIPALGTSTQTSMQLGVERGFVAEIQEQIRAFSQAYGDFTIILTGGDADFLNKKIKNTIFADADLILKGLYHLLMFNSFHEK